MLRAIRRLLSFVRRDRLDDELAEEIAQHIELRTRQLIDEGVDPREARFAARRQFGNVTRFREETRAMWGFPSLDSVVQDVRYGARILRRSPAFTALAIVSLATGIGSTAAVFNVADAVLFRSLSVRDPQQLREVRATFSIGSTKKNVSPVPPQTLAEMRRSGEVADATGFRTIDQGTVSGDAGTRTVRIELVAPNYFDMLGVVPAAGRMLTASDAGTAPVPVVLSESLWRSAFGGDGAVVGRTLSLNATPAVVVGIARGFRGVMAERPADVLAPAAAGPILEPTATAAGLRPIVRVLPGTSTAAVEQKFAPLFLAPGSMMRGGEFRVALVDARRGISDTRDTLERPLTVALYLVAVLLLLAAANTGGLMLARFTARQGEFGVRVAIGAGHSRLLRQVLTEAVLLAFIAAGAGLVVAATSAPVLLRTMPIDSGPPDFDVRFDWRLIGFTAAIALAAAAIAGAASIFRMRRTDTSAILTQNSRTVVRGRRRSTLVLIAAQVACSLLLLVAAASMTRSLVNLRRVDPGFDPSNVIVITVDALSRVNPDAYPAYFSGVHERLASEPAIARVSFAHVGLMTAGATTGSIDVPGRTPADDQERWVRMFWVGPGFFETMGMRVIAGRSIDGADAAGRERVAVVNHEFARVYFGSAANAVGRVVNRSVRILGVVNDARYSTLRDEPIRAMFVPHTQAPPRNAMTFVVRASADPASATRAAIAAVRAVDPQLRITATPLANVITATLSRERFVAALASIASVLALLLSCAGLYASVAYAVTERRGELAVRLALGATRSDIVRLVLRDPLAAALTGMAIGVPAGYAAMQGIAALLFGIAPFDVGTVAVCSFAVVAMALIATLLPARRAAALDPHECLKTT